MTPFATYLKYFFGCLFPIVFFVVAFNYVVDPAGIYHFGKSWDCIHSRFEIGNLEYIHKARAVETAQADILFLGSSPADLGLDPHDAALPAPAYNLGLDASGIYEDWRYLQHASAAHLPKIVLLGMDIRMFMWSRKPAAAFSEARLRVQPDGQPTPYYAWNDFVPTLVSTDTFVFSLKTVWATKDGPMPYDRGFGPDISLRAGHMNLVKNVLALNRVWVDNLTPVVPFRSPDGVQPQMDAFEQIVSFCADHQIRLIVVVLPQHAHKLDNTVSNWDYFGSWMKALAERMQARPDLQGELWDFEGYNSITTEPFPAPTETYSHTRYFWEGVHFHKNVGDMVLERIFQNVGPASFGHRVTLANLDDDLARLKAEQTAWHEHGTVSPPQL